MCLLGVLPGNVAPDVILLARNLCLLRFKLGLLPQVAFRALIGVGAVVAGVALKPGRLQLPNQLRRFVQEVAVMRNNQHRTAPGAQPTLQPFHAADVQMIGGLVQQQQVWPLQQQATHQCARALPARKLGERQCMVGCRKSQPLQRLPDLRLVGVAAGFLKLMLQHAVAFQRAVPLCWRSHRLFQTAQLSLLRKQRRKCGAHFLP